MNELILYIAGLLPLDRGRYLGIYDVFLKQINFVDCSWFARLHIPERKVVGCNLNVCFENDFGRSFFVLISLWTAE